MIIACPACGTKYVLPEDALGAEGRTVRCAKCKHSWFQDGAEIALPARPAPAPPPEPAPADVARPADDEPVAVQPAIPITEAPQPPAKPRPAPEPVSDPSLPDALVTPPPFYRAPANQPSTKAAEELEEDENSSGFDFRSPFGPQRDRSRLLTVGAATFAALALALIAAVQIWGLPSWLSGSDPMFAGEEPGLTMSFPDNQQQTRETPDGGEFLAISGTVTNTSSETRSVPSILVVLRDARDRVVFSQEIASPQPELAPGATEEIDAAIADIPQSATDAEFGWAPR